MIRTTLLLLVLFASTTTTSIIAQQTRLTPELLWQLGRVSLDAVSPDGSYAVYGVQNFNVQENKGSRSLYIVRVADGATTPLTTEGTSSDTEFHPDGKRIGFLRDGNLYEVALDGSQLRKVSELSFNGFHYAPDGKHILFTQDVKLDAKPTEIHPDLPKTSGRVSDGLMYRHWKSWHDYQYSHVFYVSYDGKSLIGTPKDIMAGEKFDCPLRPLGGMEQIQWSPDGKRIAYTCRKLSGTEEAKSTNSDIYLYDLAAGTTANICSDLLGYDIDPVFSPDGRYIAWTSQERPGYEADRTRLMVQDLATNQRRELTAGWQWECNHPQWATDSKSLYFLSSQDYTYQIYQVGLADAKINRLTTGRHDYNALKVGQNGTLIATRTANDAPPEVFAVKAATGEARAISHVNDVLWGGISKGKVERHTVKTTDGKDMNAWVVLPPDFDATKKYPTLVVCQGGPQSAMSQNFSFRWNYQLMANQGYVVIAPCRRGMPGGPEGQAWNDAIAGDWGGQAMQDLLSATDYMRDKPYVNKDAVGAVGASFGGYSVYWLAGNHNKRFSAFISHCGMFNTTSWYGTTEEMWFAQHDLGADYWSKPTDKAWEQFSPHRFVDKWDTPMLVIHNELDFRVPFSEGMQAFNAAQMRGIPSRMLSFPDEGHWMSKPQNSILWQREFYGWLDQWLKNKP
jgi:dipeptidyl aminopeptidase/acylaminoacyl peptidase